MNREPSRHPACLALCRRRPRRTRQKTASQARPESVAMDGSGTCVSIKRSPIFSSLNGCPGARAHSGFWLCPGSPSRLVFLYNDSSDCEDPTAQGRRRRLDRQVTAAAGMPCAWPGPRRGLAAISGGGESPLRSAARERPSHTGGVPRQVQSCRLNMGKYPSWNCRQLDHRLREIGCQAVRGSSGSHRHYSNPFRPDRLITFAWHPGDVPRGIIADIIEDLGVSRDDFCFRKF